MLVDSPEMAAIAAQKAGLEESYSLRWTDIEMQLLTAIEGADPYRVALAMQAFTQAARSAGRVLESHDPSTSA